MLLGILYGVLSCGVDFIGIVIHICIEFSRNNTPIVLRCCQRLSICLILVDISMFSDEWQVLEQGRLSIHLVLRHSVALPIPVSLINSIVSHLGNSLSYYTEIIVSAI